MGKLSVPKAFRAVAAESHRRLERLITQAASPRLKRMYEDAEEELVRKLRRLAGGETMTYLQVRQMQELVRRGQAAIAKKLTGALGKESEAVQAASLHGLMADLTRLEREFTGVSVPLPVAEASVFRGIVAGRRTSLMQAHASSMRRYGATLVQKMEHSLSQSLMTGDTPREAVERLSGVADAEWWRAERVVRTELSWASNQVVVDGLRAERAGGLDDLMARWSEHVDDSSLAPLDDRVAVDSIAMHGQVARPGDGFTMPPSAPQADSKGQDQVPAALVGDSWLHPPNRPNDRAVLQPWRPHWGVPGWVWSGDRRVQV